MVALSTFRWTAKLSACTLRHLAAIAEQQEDRREFIDPERAAAELAEMMSHGLQPSLGWWRRNLVPRYPLPPVAAPVPVPAPRRAYHARDWVQYPE